MTYGARQNQNVRFYLVTQIYDPLGFPSSSVFVAKIVVLDLWRSGTSWDDSVRDILCKLEAFSQQLVAFSELKLPRFVEPSAQFVDLLGFCDTS